ncbi:Altered inheritance of mitochondria protein 3 [Grifola frondosa]|uniref:Altered inheritance of mitochondria protein 3 n=1 Tax=Grifola frondosa TaxID=5627 RepID=A0A1C7MEQ4_GRIFR|nr:Altered inheritance of mitochondria protein 3 [Grifola frondosa]
MPSFADLKDKALKAKDIGATKLVNTRDRYTSTSSKNINWNADITKKPPPPPPSRSVVKERLPPPPQRRFSPSTASPSHSDASAPSSPVAPPPKPMPWSRHSDQATPSAPISPSAVARNSHHEESDSTAHRVDWANFSPEDKQVFFSWLDEYFSRHFNVSQRSSGPKDPVQRPETPAVSVVSQASAGPPQLPLWSRPKQPSITPPSQGDSFTTSYPPPTEHGSAALDLAYYFTPSAHWDSSWYTSSNPMPPFLQGNSQIVSTYSWQTLGTSKTIDFSSNANADPNDTRAVQRSARYLPRPQAMDRAALVEAHETYGETTAAFAESFEGTGQACGRGECWDLASEALKYFDQYDYVPKPVPSISRTQGHLIFEGKASGHGRAHQVGRWRGGDDRVRRGDMVEWRSVRISMRGGAWATLGNPDHTAVIVTDAVPSVPVADGQSVKPAELGTLEVVEQSVGKPPARASYDLDGLEEGEMWIYRPVGMVAYVGSLLEVKCPEGVNALTV